METAELTALLEPILPAVADAADAAETERRPSRPVMKQLGDAGLMRLMVPTDYGGHAVHPHLFMDFIEQIAQVHASLAWTAMTCNEEAGITSAYLDAGHATEFFAANPTAVIAGSGVPKGRATKVPGGWEITGRWPFVSGCTASDWVVLANLVVGTKPVMLCFVLVPTADVTIDDTWHTIGLRGTGSNDVVLERHFVPSELAGENPSFGLPKPDTPFYRLPSGLRFPFPKVGVAAGISRAALDDFAELAGAKKPLYHKSTLRERATAQAAMARAEALVGSSRAWVRELVDELWDDATAGRPITAELHARCRLACTHAVSSCIAAVELLASEAGSTSNFTSSPLGRHVNDARAVAAHSMVAPYHQQTAGRLLLGLDADDPGF